MVSTLNAHALIGGIAKTGKSCGQLLTAAFGGCRVRYTPAELNRLISATVAQRLCSRADWHHQLASLTGDTDAAYWHRSEAHALDELAVRELAGEVASR